MKCFRDELIELMLKHRDLEVGYTNPHLVIGIIESLEFTEQY